MPIEGLQDVVRVPRQFTIRLGTRVQKVAGVPTQMKVRSDGGYPTEVDYFVLRDEEVPEDIRKLYGKEPKALRLMLLTEYDEVDDRALELSLDLNNRAWRARGLRCWGHGRAADEVGNAYTNDEGWARRIAEATKGMATEVVDLAERKRAPLPGAKVWRVTCWGQDCPKYMRNVEGEKPDGTRGMVPAPGHDHDAACAANIILRAWLLHPHFGEQGHSNERTVLAGVQVASGSYNSIVQLRSGFKLMKPFTGGRTAGIPFRLIRKPTETFTPVRTTHWTLDVVPEPDLWQRFATIPLGEMFMSDELREQRRLMLERPLGTEFSVVSDLYPAKPRELAAQSEASPGASHLPGADERPAAELDKAAAETPPPSTALDDVLLNRSETNELRQLFGTRRDPQGPDDDQANPYDAEVNEKLVAAIKLYDEAHGTSTKKFSELTHRHARFIKDVAARQPRKDGD